MVFVHGLLVNADLWRDVVPVVADTGLRCIAPDWPMGSHPTAVPGADLSPPGLAALIAAFLERLDLDDVSIVANDTGGAITQILMTRHPSGSAAWCSLIRLPGTVLPTGLRIPADDGAHSGIVVGPDPTAADAGAASVAVHVRLGCKASHRADRSRLILAA